MTWLDRYALLALGVLFALGGLILAALGGAG